MTIITPYEDAIMYLTQDNKTQNTESDSEIKTKKKRKLKCQNYKT